MVTNFSAILVRLAGNNSLTNLFLPRILKPVELILNHELYTRLPGLIVAYNNGKTVPWEKIFASYKLVFELTRG